MVEHMLTTSDNPFNPFTEWNEWFVFDTSHGYHTASYLARVVKTSEELSEPDQILANEQAIDEIVKEDVNGLYLKVTRDMQPFAKTWV
jgi:hypothetical protein